MLKFPVAIQLYSLRDVLGDDFEGTLRKLKEMGYDGVEFANLYGRSAAEVKALCDEIGLVPISTHVPLDSLMAGEGALRIYSEIGCKYIVIPYLTEEYRPGHEKYDQLVETAKRVGARAKDFGMTLCYHNHDFEFEKIDGEYALDRLYKDVPADLLETQLDTCWVNVGGENPADYIRKYAGRVNIVHLKDFVGSKSENMYALIGIDEDEDKDTKGQFEFRPVGYGLQKFPAILEACEEVGAKWVVVEQDQPTMGKTSLECAEMSINYLRSL